MCSGGGRGVWEWWRGWLGWDDLFWLMVGWGRERAGQEGLACPGSPDQLPCRAPPCTWAATCSSLMCQWAHRSQEPSSFAPRRYGSQGEQDRLLGPGGRQWVRAGHSCLGLEGWDRRGATLCPMSLESK